MTGLEYSWACLDCDEHGAGPKAIAAADKHCQATRHSTHAWAVPRPT
jgi:hypothetical protein